MFMEWQDTDDNEFTGRISKVFIATAAEETPIKGGWAIPMSAGKIIISELSIIVCAHHL